MKQGLYIHEKVEEKLKNKHNLDPSEVLEVWNSYSGIELEDNREAHRSSPTTLWFVAKSFKSGRTLKLVYVPYTPTAVLRTAYDANSSEINIFKMLGGTI